MQNQKTEDMKTYLLALSIFFFSSVCTAAGENSFLSNDSDPSLHARLIVENGYVYSILGQEDGTREKISKIEIQHIVYDRDSNVYVVGGFCGTAFLGDSLVESLGLFDMFVAKFDRSGRRFWLVIRGTAGSDVAHGIALDMWGNVYVVGIIDDSLVGQYGFPSAPSKTNGVDGFLFSFDWRGVQFASQLIVSGKAENGAFAVVADKYGDIYVTGTCQDTAVICGDTIASLGAGDLFLVKLTSGGHHVLTRLYGTSWGDERGVGLSVGSYTGQVNVYFDYNVKGGNRYHLWYDNYATEETFSFSMAICQGCIDEAVERSTYTHVQSQCEH